MSECKHSAICGLLDEADPIAGLCILHSKKAEKDISAFDEALATHREMKGPKFSFMVFPALADFSSSTFHEDAFFTEAIFTKGAFFRKATFTKGADFTGTTFTEMALQEGTCDETPFAVRASLFPFGTGTLSGKRPQNCVF